jgi:aryl carrier-like protein
MIPTTIISVPAFPINQNGKLDRAALEALAPFPNAPLAPRTTIETIICGIWEHILGKTVNSVEDDFFALGGDSIMSVRVLAALRHHGWSLAYQDFYGSPTIAGLALFINRQTSAIPHSEDGIVIQLQRGLVSDRPAIWWIHDGTGGISPSCKWLPLCYTWSELCLQTR